MCSYGWLVCYPFYVCLQNEENINTRSIKKDVKFISCCLSFARQDAFDIADPSSIKVERVSHMNLVHGLARHEILVAQSWLPQPQDHKIP